MMRRSLFILLACIGLGAAWGNPSAFPETALAAAVGFRVGPGPALGGVVGGEVLLPVSYLDTAVQGLVLLDTAGRWGARLSGSVLVFPALSLSPPLALGFGADVGYDEARGFGMHAGPVLGSDLLFTTRLPITLSLYLAPGYAARQGFSLAWALQARYYGDEVAVELSSSDLMTLAAGVRYLF